MKHALLHPLSEYRAFNHDDLGSFYDHNWAKEFFGVFGDGELKDACFSLCASLKSASIVHSYPQILSKAVKAAVGGALGRNARDASMNLSKFAELIKVEIVASREQHEKIEEVLAVAKLSFANAGKSVSADESEIWDSVCNSSIQTLVVATTGAQRLVFTGMFFALEHFCHRCCCLVAKDDELWWKYRSKKGSGLVEEIFSASLYDQVLGGYIDTARMVRNALAHHGGRVTSELRSANHGFYITPDELIIRPEDNRKLFAEIKQRCLMIATETVRRCQ